MSDEMKNLDERIRELEIKSSANNESIANINMGISDIKKMMSQLMGEHNRVSEIAVKISAFDRIEAKTDDLQRKYEVLNTAFLTVQTQHTICQSNKEKQEGFMDNLDNRLTKIENSVSILAESKSRVESTIWKWVDRAGWFLAAALLIMALTHVDTEKLGSNFGITTGVSESQRLHEQLEDQLQQQLKANLKETTKQGD